MRRLVSRYKQGSNAYPLQSVLTCIGTSYKNRWRRHAVALFELVLLLLRQKIMRACCQTKMVSRDLLRRSSGFAEVPGSEQKQAHVLLMRTGEGYYEPPKNQGIFRTQKIASEGSIATDIDQDRHMQPQQTTADPLSSFTWYCCVLLIEFLVVIIQYSLVYANNGFRNVYCEIFRRNAIATIVAHCAACYC